MNLDAIEKEIKALNGKLDAAKAEARKAAEANTQHEVTRTVLLALLEMATALQRGDRVVEGWDFSWGGVYDTPKNTIRLRNAQTQITVTLHRHRNTPYIDKIGY